MTLQELNQHFELLERLDKAIEMRDALMAAACPGAQVLTGMPHTPGVKDKVGDLAVEIADMDAQIEYIQKEIQQNGELVSAWICGIEDNTARIIFRLRYIRGLQWKEVAGIIGKYATEASVKNIAYRYLGEQIRADF